MAPVEHRGPGGGGGRWRVRVVSRAVCGELAYFAASTVAAAASCKAFFLLMVLCLRGGRTPLLWQRASAVAIALQQKGKGGERGKSIGANS